MSCWDCRRRGGSAAVHACLVNCWKLPNQAVLCFVGESHQSHSIAIGSSPSSCP